ncbi:hypothetical protein FNH13_12700 [Ornithinimicrobium ciconiae]|uniref:DoxX family membrane protein n=1 Tax=Ornithinimicrobium ciconiae TaxID=2594265 RepID=A0A516GC63_9MICO|nr:hypothetical protein [Ornithinimicrobium ciconiae]QDO89077.1 hypothetical protein FNH13_12700 [Ornithinimicrobium ciconiae]
MHPTHIPLRTVTGAYILNSGMSKLGADQQTAEGLHGMASGAYPFLSSMDPKSFTELLAYGEIALGGALLAPMVPSAVAGTALAGFGAGLVGMYLRTPGMTREDGIRPTQEGTPLAKDAWLLGAGLTLATQSFLSGTKAVAKHAGRSARDAAGNLTESARDAAGSLAESAREAVPFTS